MTPFERVLAVANALPAEDLPLLLRALLERYPAEEWPSLFTGRPQEDVERLVLWLVLGFEPAEQGPLLLGVVERMVDREEPETLKALLDLARWLEASLGSGGA